VHKILCVLIGNRFYIKKYKVDISWGAPFEKNEITHKTFDFWHLKKTATLNGFLKILLLFKKNFLAHFAL